MVLVAALTLQVQGGFGRRIDLGAAPAGADAAPDGGAGGAPCEIVTYTPPTARVARTGELCRPAGAAKPTAVVLVHAGGGLLGDHTLEDRWRDVYRTAGYVTLAIDYRLADDSGGGVYPEPEQNVKAAVQHLRRDAGGVGADAVVVHGSSAGARLGGIALTTAGDPAFAGRELWPGVTDEVDAFVGLYGYYDGFQFGADTYYGDTDDAGAPPAGAVSTALAARASGPAYLVHGEDDAMVPADQSTAFAEALRAAGRSVEYDLVPGAGHGFDADTAHGATDRLSAVGATEAASVLAWLARVTAT